MFKASSLPAQITGCYAWSFTLQDKRRGSLLGRGCNSDTVTGVAARAHLLSGLACTLACTTFPVIAADAADEEEEDAQRD
eukprot:3951488-Alexandrium_andersonii.AAC.1